MPELPGPQPRKSRFQVVFEVSVAERMDGLKTAIAGVFADVASSRSGEHEDLSVVI